MNVIKIFLRKIKTVFNNPKVVFIRLLHRISPFLEDELYLKLLFRLNVGYKLNLDNPMTYNEKMQWLKINYRVPLFTRMVDKWEVKDIISDKIGRQYIAKGYGVWSDFEDIDFNKLPDKFVLKPTHTSGSVVICSDKKDFDKKAAKKLLNKALKQQLFYLSREWPYKNVQPRILAEEFLDIGNNNDLLDYKFYCFNGEPKMMYVANAKSGVERIISYYDMSFNKIDIIKPKMIENVSVNKPVNFEKMKTIARKLSYNHPFIRIDFFEVNGELKFSEYTFYHSDGMSPFYPIEWDYTFGRWIDLDNIKSF